MVKADMRPKTPARLPQKRPASKAAQATEFFKTVAKVKDDRSNGTGTGDELSALTEMVLQHESLQKRRDVLNTLTGLHVTETYDYCAAARQSSGKIIPEHQPYIQTINLLGSAMLACMKHRRMDQYMDDRRFAHGYGRTIYDSVHSIAHGMDYAPDVRMTAFELLPWDVAQSAKRQSKKATPKIYGDDRHDVVHLLDYCRGVFDTATPDPVLQRRMVACVTKPFIGNIAANRYNWMGDDACIMDILELPVCHAVDKDVREDAIALSYRYIKEKIPQKTFTETLQDKHEKPIQSKLGIQADYLVRLAQVIGTDYPAEATYLMDESVLVRQEQSVQQKLYDFAKTTAAMTTQRNYPAMMEHLHVASSTLIEEQRIYQEQQSAFHAAHAVPEILLRMF